MEVEIPKKEIEEFLNKITPKALKFFFDSLKKSP